MRSAVVILAHGSRNEPSVRETLDRLVGRVKSLLIQEVEVGWAVLQFNRPDLGQAVEALVARGIERIVIVPYFLFRGRHITEDVPKLIEGMRKAHPEVEFLLADIVGLDEHMVDRVVKQIEKVAPDLLPKGPRFLVSPSDIERESLKIVKHLLLPLNCSEEEKVVVERIVHSAGDRHIASLVRFHPKAVPAGISAIRCGSPIFTDVKMVSVGINRNLAGNFGCPIRCALDEPEVAEKARENGITRCAAAFEVLGERLKGAVAVVGNSPTALLALLDLAQRGIKPALIVGMPVGFVQAEESKEDLMRQDVPYITIEGTRGGSAAAVATVNALLELAGR